MRMLPTAKCHVAHNPPEPRAKMLGPLRRDRIPSPVVCIVHTFFGIFLCRQNIRGNAEAICAVFPACFGDGCLVPLPIKRNDLRILNPLPPFRVRSKGLSLIKTGFFVQY